jgi:O-antigen/teichoic acid export membrane protein
MALLFGLVIGFVSPASLFGAEYAAFAEIMKRCAYIGLVIIALDFVFLTFEHVRNGYQEARFSNAWGAGGNIVAALTLALAIRIHPSVETLILAIHGPALLAKVGNTVHLFFQRPYILRSLATFTRQSARLVARGSVGYTIAYVVWCSVEYVIPVLLLGRFIGPSAAGIYEIYVLLHSSFNGVLHMVNFPLLPAFIDAHARGDRIWVERVRRRLQYGTLLLALAAVLGSGLLGTSAMNLWVGEKVVTDPITMTLFGTWFGLHAWRQSHQVILLGLGKLRSCAIAALVEGGIATTLVWIVVSTQWIPGARGVFAALCIAMLLVTAWVFPRLLRKSMPPAETE